MRISMFRIFCLLIVCCSSTLLRAAERPNIIFFLSDDQRADFLSCAGHPIVKTPHVDALAEQGIRFENSFVTTSICAASRATLFTGLYERTHKYTFGMPAISPEYTAGSYPTVLKKAGYRTGFVGKFGVNVSGGAKDGLQFDYFVPLGRNKYWKPQPDGTKKHLTNITGDKAIEFLETCDDSQPFCLSVSFNASHAEDNDKKDHYPWPHEEDGLYEDITIPEPLVSRDFWKQLPSFFHSSMHRDRYHWRWDTPEKYQKNVKAYYRMITGLDRNVGRVVEAARKRGFGDNTVIIFMGDNGYYKGSRGFAGKWSHFEESLRVPLVIFDPRVPKKDRGRVVKEMGLNVDVPATMVAMATGSIPDHYQGVDLTPLVYYKPVKNWRTDFFCEHLMDRFDIPKYEGVRDQRYVYARYIQNMPEGEFLHDLEVDPLQLQNFKDDPQYAAILEKMRTRCNELRDEYGGEYSIERFPTVRYLNEQKKKQKQKK